jgi:16S rRNA (guanine(966)-N(2))-methyltransferase RsmD
VISGIAKGKPLKSVPGMGTRPTTDKVKEAVFSMIGPYFDGGFALDLFAGTGGLGIEALSRGVDRAIFIDMDKKSVDVIRENVQSCGFGGQAELYRNDAARALKALSKRGLQPDFVFIDPPYRLLIVEDLLLSMGELDLLKQDAVIVVEQPSGRQLPQCIGKLECSRTAEYGETAIMIYHMINGIKL